MNYVTLWSETFSTHTELLPSDSCFYLGLQKNLYWMRSVRANMTIPSMNMAKRFFPTMSQPRGSLKRFSPDRKKMGRNTER